MERSNNNPKTNEKTPLMRSGIVQNIQTTDDNEGPQQFKTYKRRWYVLALFTAIALVCNMDWNTWGPISEPCQIAFGWGNWQILFLSSWAATSIIVSALFMTWVMEKRGLRVSVILCAFLVTVGKAFQVIPSSNPMTRTILINIGQCIAMLSCPIGFGSPPSISATWFPPAERTTATAIATLVAYLGLSMSFIIGPAMVPIVKLSHTSSSINATLFNIEGLRDSVVMHDINIMSNTKIHHNNAGIQRMRDSITLPSKMRDIVASYDVKEIRDNVTQYDIPRMRDNITYYMAVQLAISAFLLVCVLVYFPDRPPLPPSESSNAIHHTYSDGLKQLLLDKSYLYLGFLFSISYGVYVGWMSVLALAVKPFGVSEKLAGWLGCVSIIAGCCSGICLARFVDYVKRQIKSVLIVMFMGTTISQLLFSLTCSNVIPYSETLLYSSIVLGGLFFNGTTPLLFEMAIETVYPIAEGITAILLLVGGCIVYLVFVIAFMFPGMDVAWMNWATVVFNGVCVPGLMFHKTKFTRLALDEH